MSSPKFAETYNLVAFLDKPKEGVGFEEIVDFLNASHIKYALTVNPTVYESCIQQFWATAKRCDLKLDDAGVTNCLPNDVIFEQLSKMGAKTTAWNEFSSTMASAIICLSTNHKFNFSKYIFDNMVKHLEGGVKILLFLRITPLFNTIMVQASEEKKQKSMRKQRKETEVSQDDTQHEENIPTPSNDLQPSGKDRMQLTKLMILCTNLQKQVLDLEKAKDAQAKEIADLKKRVQKLDKREKSRPTGLTRLRKFDAEVTLINETQEKQDEDLMFDTRVLDGDEVVIDVVAGEKEEQGTKVDEMEVSTAEVVTTASKAVTTVVKDSASPTITVTIAATTLTIAVSTPAISKDELSLTETLIEIKAAKFKAITSAATTVSTRPKAKAIVFHEQEEQAATFRPVVSSAQSSKSKYKGKKIMIELEKPLKKKDQVALDEEMARNLEAQMQDELIEEERLKRQSEEEENIALIES
ncbi:hypothetical protein Tco_1214710 [Tanacetum coccineum]